jgi:hypothetical protein
MVLRTRAVPKGWHLILELYLRSDGDWAEHALNQAIRFSNGETVFAVKASKKYFMPMRLGVFRLYRSKLGHPKVRASRGVSYEIQYEDRICRYIR